MHIARPKFYNNIFLIIMVKFQEKEEQNAIRLCKAKAWAEKTGGTVNDSGNSRQSERVRLQIFVRASMEAEQLKGYFVSECVKPHTFRRKENPDRRHCIILA